jgi:predicted HAD superfamily Cof-like phosphohydrolase
MKHQINSVSEFHKKFEVSQNENPGLIPYEDFLLRYHLMKEENDEYLHACKEENLVEVADALGDMLYILCGTMLKHGMQDKIEKVFDEIHRSNMSKLGPDGKPMRRPDGKILKGEGYTPPNLDQFFVK